MKQLEKKDLVDGEIYICIITSINYKYLIKKTKDLHCDNIEILPLKKQLYFKGGFDNSNNQFFEATPEEKHWLEVCIAANSFISYEEAMKTFIPEYVECIREETIYGFYGKLKIIYKVIDWNHSISDCMLEGTTSDFTSKKRFKPSTKEAYDAQFIVKESEFVLPEKWQIKRNEENHEIINNWMNNHHKGKITNSTNYISSNYFANNFNLSKLVNKQDDVIEITFEQFKKYVLKEQLEEPKDKVLHSTSISGNYKITKVESSEGAIYQLGDEITVFIKDSKNKGKLFTITGFRWSKDKSQICALTSTHWEYGIGLDKIELYSEPVVKELSLLEQAKLKYPVGTKFRTVRGMKKLYTVQLNDIFEENSDGAICIYSMGNGTVYFNNQWAEIIVEDFKLPETWWITIENQKQLKIAKQYFSPLMNNLSDLSVGGTIGYFPNRSVMKYAYSLAKSTKSDNPQITFEQFEQYVLHNGFKVGDRFNKQKNLLQQIFNVSEKEIIDLQYIDGQSVAFYKIIENNYSEPGFRILTKNIKK